MDKYEYKEKTEEMLALAEKKQYKEAMEIADLIDWKRVKSVFMLSAVSDIYEHNGDYTKSREILKLAYERQPGSRKMAYRLGTLALKDNDLQGASEFYEEFVKIAPKDPNQYILKYKILKAQDGDLQEQIAALEEFKEAEYIEKWAYELALLYHQAGRTTECLEECDDLILWFSDGKYVYRAMELKMKYKPLTPLQQVKYDNRPGVHARRAAQAEAEASEKSKARAAEAAKLAAERSAVKAAKNAVEEEIEAEENAETADEEILTADEKAEEEIADSIASLLKEEAAEEEAEKKAAEEEEKARILDEKTRKIPDDIVRLMAEIETDMTGEIELPEEEPEEVELEEEEFDEEDFEEADFEEEVLEKEVLEEEPTQVEVPVLNTEDEEPEFEIELEADEESEEAGAAEETVAEEVESAEAESEEAESEEEEFDEEDFEEADFEEADFDEVTAEEEFTEAKEDGFAELKMSDEAVPVEFDEDDFDEEEFEEAVLEALENEKKAEEISEDDFEEEELDEDDFEEEELSPEDAIKDIDKALAALEIEEPTEEEIQRRIKKNAKAGVPFDTGFVVTGRYDLSATSEIGLKAGLTEEQKKLFSYFVPVRGMSEQIVDVLDNDRRAQREGTSKTGNIMLIGRKGSGKTVLAVDIVKAIQKQRNLKQGKVAIISGEALSKKDMRTIFQKLRGGALIVEKAGSLTKKAVIDMNLLMETKTGELLIVLEDQKKPMERLMTANPEFKKKFSSKLELPVFVNDDLVTFGQTYAKENGCKLDEMGILALYSRIDALQREDHAVSVAEVKDIMDEAIEHSRKANVKHLARRMFGKRKDDKNRTILTEEDFKF